MYPDLSLFFICGAKLLAIKCLNVWWQATSNITSVRGSWLSTSQESPSPLALSGTLFSMVIWGSNGKPTFPSEPGCTKEVAEAHWQHGDWWQSSGCWQGTMSLWTSCTSQQLGQFQSVCLHPNTCKGFIPKWIFINLHYQTLPKNRRRFCRNSMKNSLIQQICCILDIY